MHRPLRPTPIQPSSGMYSGNTVLDQEKTIQERLAFGFGLDGCCAGHSAFTHSPPSSLLTLQSTSSRLHQPLVFGWIEPVWGNSRDQRTGRERGLEYFFPISSAGRCSSVSGCLPPWQLLLPSGFPLIFSAHSDLSNLLPPSSCQLSGCSWLPLVLSVGSSTLPINFLTHAQASKKSPFITFSPESLPSMPSVSVGPWLP